MISLQGSLKSSYGSATLVPRKIVLPAVVFFIGAITFIVLFSLARINFLEVTQATRASIFLDNLYGIAKSSGQYSQILTEQILDTLSGTQLFECVSVKPQNLTYSIDWPFKGCGQLAESQGKEPFIHIQTSAQDGYPTVKAYFDRTAPLDSYAQEFWFVLISVGVTTILMLIATNVWFKSAIRRPIKQILYDLEHTINYSDLSDGCSTPNRTKIDEIELLAKRYKAVLKRSRELIRKEKFEESLKNKSLNALILADESQQIIEFNPTAERIFGYSKAEVLGKRIGETIMPQFHIKTPEAAQAFYKYGDLDAALGKGVFEIEAKNADGEFIDVEMRVETIHNDNEEFLVAYLNDISEAKKREKELINARDAYEQANKAKDSFLAMMSHELRTPLNGVLGLIRLLLEEDDLHDKHKSMLNIAENSGENLLRILNDILDLTLVGSGQLVLEKTVFSVRKLCQETLDLTGLEAREKGLDFVLEIDEDIPEKLCGDETRLRQILLNMVSNATKFTEKGHVKLNVKTVKHIQPDEFELLVEVEDTGAGLSDQDQSVVFEPFIQSKTGYSRRHEGSGLGLAISKRLIELMGGTIGVESKLGKGSRFWCKLPVEIADCQHTTTSDPTKVVDEMAKLQGRVLLVEDSPSNALVATLMLNSVGLSVDVVGDGLKAIQSVRLLPYDLVLMDISMPGMDGLETTRRIQNILSDNECELPNKPTLPIIAMTANAMRGDKEKCLAAGMIDYISKPVSKDSIVSVVSKWLTWAPRASPEY